MLQNFINNSIFIPSLILIGLLGIGFGIILAIFSKLFFVKKDKRIQEIEKILPGLNCGACGFAGCSGYAKAIVTDDAPANLCAPGGDNVIHNICDVMGTESTAAEKKIAAIHCQGDNEKTRSKAEYDGIEDCRSVKLYVNSIKECVYGCIGLGSCVKVCPFDALYMNDNGLPVVLEDKCTGCGKCVEICPNNIISLIPVSQKVYLGCVNTEKGKSVKNACDVGCTGCTLCSREKITPSGKIKINNNLPVLPPDWNDYQNAVEKCPGKCFIIRT